jgi:hypothetical protein
MANLMWLLNEVLDWTSGGFMRLINFSLPFFSFSNFIILVAPLRQEQFNVYRDITDRLAH